MQVTDETVELGCKAIADQRGYVWPDEFSDDEKKIGRENMRAALTAALSDKQAAEVKIKPLEVEEVGDPEAWLFHDPPERRIMVRPLRWKGPDSSGEYHSLDGLWGYILRAKNGNGFWLTEVGGYFPTVEAARAAAQADYEQRIRSALVDVPAVEPVAWMIEWRFKASGSDIKFPGGGSKVLWGHDASKAAADTEASRLSAIDTVDWVSCRPLYTSPPLSREGEDSAEVTAAIRSAGIKARDELLERMADGGSVDNDLADYMSRIIDACERAALAATRSGSATTAKGCAE